MKYALNSKGDMTYIMKSLEGEQYKCPVCKEILTRKFGSKNQYYSHPKGKGDDCDVKMKLILKEEQDKVDEEQADEDKAILDREYYNKDFSNVKVIFSDYLNEDGLYVTQEQKDVIFSEEDRLKIPAVAGSGKSTTLYYYAKERPEDNILYIVYNKSMKEEAEKTFGKLHNVTIKTIHGLAFGYEGRKYVKRLTNSYKPLDVMDDLGLGRDSKELASKVHYMMSEFMLSDAYTFDDLDIFDEGDKLKDQVKILCKKLWNMKKDLNGYVKVEHDFYLKLFQLSRKKLNRKYDIVMVDECQDASKLVIELINNSNIYGVVMTGDNFQSIYKWRKAINIMELFNEKEYNLTTSFRVSPAIANISNLIIEDVCNAKINMKGFNKKQEIVDAIDKKKPYACLCRTNAYIFSEVIEALDANPKAKLYFEGGYSGYKFENVKDAYDFSLGYKVRNSLFSKFKSYYDMLDYIEEVEDLELISLARMIDKYGSRIPSIVKSVKYSTTRKKEDADVIFTTVHRSKGQTYKRPVYISDDHFDICSVFIDKFVDNKDINVNEFFEEMCILYVAITRAAGDIELSPRLKDYLLTRYNHFAENEK